MNEKETTSAYGTLATSPATTNGATPRNSVKVNSGLCVSLMNDLVRFLKGPLFGFIFRFTRPL
jgi:hypothetical protein